MVSFILKPIKISHYIFMIQFFHYFYFSTDSHIGWGSQFWCIPEFNSNSLPGFSVLCLSYPCLTTLSKLVLHFINIRNFNWFWNSQTELVWQKNEHTILWFLNILFLNWLQITLSFLKNLPFQFLFVLLLFSFPANALTLLILFDVAVIILLLVLSETYVIWFLILVLYYLH